jgi:isopenicillin N synthase-like dioxygenase
MIWRFGFFHVTDHGLKPAQLDSLLKLGYKLFELPRRPQSGRGPGQSTHRRESHLCQEGSV